MNLLNSTFCSEARWHKNNGMCYNNDINAEVYFTWTADIPTHTKNKVSVWQSFISACEVTNQRKMTQHVHDRKQMYPNNSWQQPTDMDCIKLIVDNNMQYHI